MTIIQNLSADLSDRAKVTLLKQVLSTKQPKIIITIDGPSGVGKGTLAQKLAGDFNFNLLDSGAMYRLLALFALRNDIALDNESELATATDNLDISFESYVEDGGLKTKFLLAGEDVSLAIRNEEVTAAASKVAVWKKVRAGLLDRQRDLANIKGIIADGRDMGTVVFPNAEVKIFLDANANERANRRFKQLQQNGFNANFSDILQDIIERDKRDRERANAPLKPAEDAFVLDSSDLEISDVINLACVYIFDRISQNLEFSHLFMDE